MQEGLPDPACCVDRRASDRHLARYSNRHHLLFYDVRGGSNPRLDRLAGNSGITTFPDLRLRRQERLAMAHLQPLFYKGLYIFSRRIVRKRGIWLCRMAGAANASVQQFAADPIFLLVLYAQHRAGKIVIARSGHLYGSMACRELFGSLLCFAISGDAYRTMKGKGTLCNVGFCRCLRKLPDQGKAGIRQHHRVLHA